MSKRQIGGSIRRIETMSGPRWRFRADIGTDPATGKRLQRTFTFKTEKEAVDAQTATRGQVATQTYVDRSVITVEQYLKDWLAAGKRDWRRSTWRSYELALVPAIDAFGDKKLQKVQRRDIEDLMTTMLTTGGRKGEGRSPRTATLLLTILRKAFKDAMADDLLLRNPTQHVRRPRSEHVEMMTWNKREAGQFADHVKDHRLAGSFALTMRGLRRGEVLGLQWGDIDWEAGEIHIRRARVQAGSQGVVEGEPKTKRGIRTIPMDDALRAALKATYKATVTDATVRPIGSPSKAYVTVTEAGEPMRPEAYGDLFKKMSAEAGLPAIRLHDARHTAATLLILAGAPFPIVACFLGQDPAVLMRTYAHVTKDAMKAAGDIFTALFQTS